MDLTANEVYERFMAAEREKQPWLNTYQRVGEYVMSRKQSFTVQQPQAAIFNEELFDDTAQESNHKMASSLIGALWPNGAKSFRILAPLAFTETKSESDEVKKYYEYATRQMAYYMDQPESGLGTSLDEYMLDQGAFGISGIGAYDNDDPDVPIIYTPYDAKKLYIDENSRKFVDTIFIKQMFTARQLIQEYGYDNVSKHVKDCYDKKSGGSKKGESEQIEVLTYIGPRTMRDPDAPGAKNMPYRALHMELKTKKLLRETGYNSLPIAVCRFWKAMGEKYGRSPGMNSLPSIREANALRELFILAAEKNLDPPIQVMDDSSLGNGVVDTSPGGVTVFTITGRLGNTNAQKPVDLLYPVGDPSWAMQRLQDLKEIISNHFFMDRLMDLNNETRMTLGEANIRNKLRGESLNPIFTRQITELFKPLIDRTFEILFNKGLLGVIKGSELERQLIVKGIRPIYVPDAIAELIKSGQNAYRVEFISPASRIMQVDELSGITQSLEAVGGIVAFAPSCVDGFDEDYTVRRITELAGGSSLMWKSLEATQKIRDARAKMQQKAADQEKDRQASETARNAAQAVGTIQNGNGS